jgi:tetratricopeptide (TPR) repeat protein
MGISKYGVHPVLILLIISIGGCAELQDAKNQKMDSTLQKNDSNLNASVQNLQQKSFQKAEQYSSNGTIKEAIQSTSDELKKTPDNQSLYVQIGNLYLQAGDTALAITALKKSIEKGNKNPETIMQLGYLFANKNDKKCLEYAQILIQDHMQQKTAYQGYFLKGIYYANTGNKKEAGIAFDKSIIDNYKFTDAYIEKAILLHESNQCKKSIKLLQKAIEIDKFQAELYYWIGRNSEKLKDLEESKYAYEQTLALAPDFENAKFRLDSLKKLR